MGVLSSGSTLSQEDDVVPRFPDRPQVLLSQKLCLWCSSHPFNNSPTRSLLSTLTQKEQGLLDKASLLLSKGESRKDCLFV